ncbi:unnamed protein product (macronuclear) [Paramecium tetraurelia]|uniref:Uncharacterized protein n=1 Tax=Paramecium tetraurelia TaxID=5888 RepID=A0BYS4_PARTE|nr:uncharacterized protein GSPATT00033544001 [Paramecium tetraurelia]CAK63691.1 unnamed protein product [Paramecium tetraurelia]|eukprot:XP_001431089.1 hypothetical protein (macronuclear) [Paramecium tetraurelia strain d4-2]
MIFQSITLIHPSYNLNHSNSITKTKQRKKQDRLSQKSIKGNQNSSNQSKKMVLEQKYQDIFQNKYTLDLTCNSWNSSSNTQAMNLNQQITTFISEQQSQILIIYGEDCLGRITLAKQTEEFIWEKQNQTTIDIPIILFVYIDNLDVDKIEQNIQKYLNLKTEISISRNNNDYRFLFLIIIQEDQDTYQIIKSINQMVKLISTQVYPKSKII